MQRLSAHFLWSVGSHTYPGACVGCNPGSGEKSVGSSNSEVFSSLLLRFCSCFLLKCALNDYNNTLCMFYENYVRSSTKWMENAREAYVDPGKINSIVTFHQKSGNFPGLKMHRGRKRHCHGVGSACVCCQGSVFHGFRDGLTDLSSSPRRMFWQEVRFCS